MPTKPGDYIFKGEEVKVVIGEADGRLMYILLKKQGVRDVVQWRYVSDTSPEDWG